MSTLGEELKSEKDLDDDLSTAVPTPIGRSTTNSIHNSKESLDRQWHEEDGSTLQQVESALYPGPAKLIPILLAVVLSIFLVALDMTIVATAIPRITDEFQSLDDVGWYGSAFFLTVAAFQSTWVFRWVEGSTSI